MFTQKTKNAIQIISFLMKSEDDTKKFSAIEIAQNLNLSSPFISKILQDLTRNKIISSTKGKGGGFYLSKENKNKTLSDVVNTFEDYDKINNCILGLEECTDKNPCILHHAYKDFKLSIKSYFKASFNKSNQFKI